VNAVPEGTDIHCFGNSAQNGSLAPFALPVAKCNPAFSQIVGREFQRDFVARQNANTIAAEAAGEVRQNDPIVLQLNAEQTTRKFLENGPGYFYTVFLTHSTSRI
jgi:hypothetical protein